MRPHYGIAFSAIIYLVFTLTSERREMKQPQGTKQNKRAK
jgi:hypothetical protein